jgi:RNA polymerase sigma-70 factor (ECF subfamily)
LTALHDSAAQAADFAKTEDDDAPVSDHALMQEIAAGDEAAYGTLMQRHLAGMIALAQRITGNSADADEVAQEAFLRLWRQAACWEPNGAQVRTWLSRVVTNLCLDRKRKRPLLPLDFAEEVAETAPGGLDMAMDTDRRNRLQQCLQRLPLRQRTVVVLSYYEELGGREIAAMMNLSPGAVESLLVRARRALRQDLMTMNILVRSDL